MSAEIKAQLDQLGSMVESFKKENDKVIEGKADALTKQFRDNLNDAITRIEEKIAAIETANARSAAVGDVKEETLHKFKKAFVHYSKTGDDRELKALSVGSANDGGDTVPEIIQNVIDRVVTESSPIRSVANVVSISNDEYYKLVSQGGAVTGWVSETGSRTATATPQTRKVTIKAHELYAYPAATLQSLEDSQFDLEGFLTEEVADAYVIAEGDAFINGAGDASNQPKGSLNSSVYARGSSWGQVRELSVAGADVASDDIYALSESIKTQYQAGASFLMNRAMRQKVRTLKAEDGHYLLQPSLALGQPATLLGYPVHECPDIAALAGSPLSGDAIVFGNFKRFYTVVDRIGMSVIRDNITSPGNVKFFFRKRVGGGVIDSNAAVVLTVG